MLKRIIGKLDIKLLITVSILVSTIIFIVLNCVYKGTLLTIADYHDHYMHYFGNMDKNNFPGGPGGFLVFPPLGEMLYGLWSMSDKVAYGKTWDIAMISTHSQFLYHIVMIVVFLLFFACINYIFIKDNYLKRQFLALAIVISFPFIVPLSIGNSVLPTCLLILLGLALYYTKNEVLIQLSLLFIALASGLKYYTAVYGVILLKNKDYKNAIKLLVLGILVFVLPLFYFEGFATVSKIISVLRSFNQQLWVNDNLYYVADRVISMVGGDRLLNSHQILQILRLLFLIIGFVGVIITNKRWRVLFYIGFICNICLINAWGYNSIYFIPAILYFMLDENAMIIDIVKRREALKMIYIIIFMLFLMNYSSGALHKLPILCMPFLLFAEDISLIKSSSI